MFGLSKREQRWKAEQKDYYARIIEEQRKIDREKCIALAKEFSVYRDHWPQRDACLECANAILPLTNEKPKDALPGNRLTER